MRGCVPLWTRLPLRTSGSGGQNRWLESHNIYNASVFGAGASVNTLCRHLCAASLSALSLSKAAAAARQMIAVAAILTGAALGGCKSLIIGLVNDAESAVEIKPPSVPLSILLWALCWCMIKMSCSAGCGNNLKQCCSFGTLIIFTIHWLGTGKMTPQPQTQCPLLARYRTI